MKVLLLLAVVVAVVFAQKDFIRVDTETRLFSDDLGRLVDNYFSLFLFILFFF